MQVLRRLYRETSVLKLAAVLCALLAISLYFLVNYLVDSFGPPRMKMVKAFAEPISTVNAVAFTPDDKFAVSASGDGILMWDVHSHTKVAEFGQTKFANGNSYPTNFAVPLHAGNQIVIHSGGDKPDQGDERFELWDYATRKKIKDIPINRPYAEICALTPDGKHLIAGNSYVFNGRIWKLTDSAIYMYDLATGEEVRKFEGHKYPVRRVVLSMDGTRLLSVGNDVAIRLWDVATGKELQSHRFSEGSQEGSFDPAIAFSTDGKVALVGLDTVFDVETWQESRPFKPARELSVISSIVVTSDGKRVLCGHERGTLTLWEFATGKEICRANAFPSGAAVLTLAVSKYGKFALAGGKGRVGTTIGSRDDGYRVSLWKLPD